MKMKIVVQGDGSVGMFSQSGTFVEGSDKIKSLFAALGAAGMNFAEISEPEQHRHDDAPHVHIGQEDHAHQH